MNYTASEKQMLESVHEIGMGIDALPEENVIFIQLMPYMDNLMPLLKRLNSTEMQMLFMQYEGVMKVMRMMEDMAQQLEGDYLS